MQSCGASDVALIISLGANYISLGANFCWSIKDMKVSEKSSEFGNFEKFATNNIINSYIGKEHSYLNFAILVIDKFHSCAIFHK